MTRSRLVRRFATVPLLRAILLFPISPAVTFAWGELLFRILRRRGGREPGLTDARRILVVRPDTIGDAVLTTPFLRELRRNASQARITLFVNSTVAPLFEGHLAVDEVFKYELSPRGAAGPYRRFARCLRILPALLKQKFDLVLLPRWGVDAHHATYAAYFSGACRRVGYSEHAHDGRKRWNRGYDRLLTDPIVGPGTRHDVERNLEPLRYLGGVVEETGLDVQPAPRDQAVVDRFLEQAGAVCREPMIAFGVGASEPRKRWPIDRFAALATQLENARGVRAVVVGGPEDEERGHDLAAACPSVVNAVGRLTLLQTAALLSRCAFHIGNDSAPLHLAASAGIPCIELSWHAADGCSNIDDSPTAFGPWGVACTVLHPEKMIRPCRQVCVSDDMHCITNITLESVIRAAERYLREPVDGRRETDRTGQ